MGFLDAYLHWKIRKELNGACKKNIYYVGKNDKKTTIRKLKGRRSINNIKHGLKIIEKTEKQRNAEVIDDEHLRKKQAQNEVAELEDKWKKMVKELIANDQLNNSLLNQSEIIIQADPMKKIHTNLYKHNFKSFDDAFTFFKLFKNEDSNQKDANTNGNNNNQNSKNAQNSGSPNDANQVGNSKAKAPTNKTSPKSQSSSTSTSGTSSSSSGNRVSTSDSDSSGKKNKNKSKITSYPMASLWSKRRRPELKIKNDSISYRPMDVPQTTQQNSQPNTISNNSQPANSGNTNNSQNSPSANPTNQNNNSNNPPAFNTTGNSQNQTGSIQPPNINNQPSTGTNNSNSQPVGNNSTNTNTSTPPSPNSQSNATPQNSNNPNSVQPKNSSSISPTNTTSNNTAPPNTQNNPTPQNTNNTNLNNSTSNPSAHPNANNKMILSDTELLWSIFYWMAHYFNYDYEGYKNNNFETSNPSVAFEKGVGTCESLSKVFKMICDQVNKNYKCETIKGFCKAVTYKVGDSVDNMKMHMWNSVVLDNQIYLIDITWAMGYACNGNFERRFNEFYFCVPPHIFLYLHFPEESKYQYLKNEYTIREFELLPYYQMQLFKFDLKGYSHDSCVIKTSTNPFTTEFLAPDDTDLSVNLVKYDMKEVQRKIV